MQKSHDDDFVRIHDMLEAALKIRNLAAGRSRQSLGENEVVQLAFRYLVLIVGEAAYHVSRERKARYSMIPWAQIIGMRHHLVHGYSAVDIDVLWVAINDDIPTLINDLKKLLNEDFG